MLIAWNGTEWLSILTFLWVFLLFFELSNLVKAVARLKVNRRKKKEMTKKN